MPICFVIQPFDGGPFDKRYDDVYVKAISDAGLEPYRVDRDPRASIPIDTIAARIRESDIWVVAQFGSRAKLGTHPVAGRGHDSPRATYSGPEQRCP